MPYIFFGQNIGGFGYLNQNQKQLLLSFKLENNFKFLIFKISKSTCARGLSLRGENLDTLAQGFFLNTTFLYFLYYLNTYPNLNTFFNNTSLNFFLAEEKKFRESNVQLSGTEFIIYFVFLKLSKVVNLKSQRAKEVYLYGERRLPLSCPSGFFNFDSLRHKVLTSTGEGGLKVALCLLDNFSRAQRHYFYGGKKFLVRFVPGFCVRFYRAKEVYLYGGRVYDSLLPCVES